MPPFGSIFTANGFRFGGDGVRGRSTRGGANGGGGINTFPPKLSNLALDRPGLKLICGEEDGEGDVAIFKDRRDGELSVDTGETDSPITSAGKAL